ncbi:macrolide-inactivating glycosyltransferase [Streptomyces yaizuensis]|uniref:Macrolide-inactivating glycosyltransferase n=2 Tax=Streptomyces yaizuensis TaxID=2989713 RepID=A0ABQ5P5S0_9ACTN|nr:macrolide-inactivating glycosyltransferase [Streptomyces sp. YSPA8]GLF97835.1 macrolide-inactivating glycosyltransferase [Streptomyces sp. YSPA8]
MIERRPAHIAMFSIAAPGHVNPSLEVVRELVARGHRVSYAIPASFADKVAATGATPVVYESVLPTEDDPDAWGTELIDNLEPFLRDAVHVLPQLVDAFAGDEPDLVIHDITAYPAPVLAHRWGVPAVSLWPNLVPWEGYEEEVAAPMFDELKKSERGQAYYARFGAWLAENGLGEVEPDHLVGRPRRGVVLIPKALQPQADRVDTDVFTFVGACQGERAEQPDWERPADAEKVLLVSLGSSFTKVPDFYRACLEAFGGLPGWHTVLQIGKHVDPAELGEIPAGVEVHPWVSQLSILRQADAFITHAGAGGSQEGLATATPMVAVPQAVDQFGNADMLAALGVARRLDSATATADELREAVLGLVGDPAVARELARISRQMGEEGGTRQAADLIEAELPVR